MVERGRVLSASQQAKHFFKVVDDVNIFMGYHSRLPKGYELAPRDFLERIPSLETPVLEIRCIVIPDAKHYWQKEELSIAWVAREVKEKYIPRGEDVTITHLYIIQGSVIHLMAFLFVPGFQEEDFLQLQNSILER